MLIPHGKLMLKTNKHNETYLHINTCYCFTVAVGQTDNYLTVRELLAEGQDSRGVLSHTKVQTITGANHKVQYHEGQLPELRFGTESNNLTSQTN